MKKKIRKFLKALAFWLGVGQLVIGIVIGLTIGLTIALVVVPEFRVSYYGLVAAPIIGYVAGALIGVLVTLIKLKSNQE